MARDQKRLLVVEDDPWTRQIMVELLADEGYEIVQAKNGEEGLELATQLRPDVVLLDLGLPWISGLEVLRALKEGPLTRDVPVVVVSAYAGLMRDNDASLTEGVLQKPFDVEDLLAQVEEAAGITERQVALV